MIKHDTTDCNQIYHNKNCISSSHLFLVFKMVFVFFQPLLTSYYGIFEASILGILLFKSNTIFNSFKIFYCYIEVVKQLQLHTLLVCFRLYILPTRLITFTCILIITFLTLRNIRFLGLIKRVKYCDSYA